MSLFMPTYKRTKIPGIYGNEFVRTSRQTCALSLYLTKKEDKDSKSWW
jgi:hypothetical protein